MKEGGYSELTMYEQHIERLVDKIKDTPRTLECISLVKVFLDDIDQSEFLGEIEVGQIWYDYYNKWTDGSKDTVSIHVVLSADFEHDDYYWKTAQFIWIGSGYRGARIRKFLEKELKLMKCVGNLDNVIKYL